MTDVKRRLAQLEKHAEARAPGLPVKLVYESAPTGDRVFDRWPWDPDARELTPEDLEGFHAVRVRYVNDWRPSIPDLPLAQEVNPCQT